MTDEAFREKMKEACTNLSRIHLRRSSLGDFSRNLFYCAGDLHDPDTYTKLGGRWTKSRSCARPKDNVLFYLSTQPSHYEAAIKGIGYAKLQQGRGWRRIVVEKPFGHDLATAHELNQKLQRGISRTEYLSDRPLSGERNRAEHTGVPIRQRHLRAAVESPIRQSRADYGRRVDRRRRPGRRTTRKRALSAT